MQFLRKVFISFEFLLACGLWLLSFLFSQPFEWIGATLGAQEELIILGTPCIFFTMSIPLTWKILFPIENDNRLQEWPRYKHMRQSTYAGLFFNIMGIVLVAVGVFFESIINTKTCGLLFLQGYSISTIAFLSMLMAALVIRSILQGER